MNPISNKTAPSRVYSWPALSVWVIDCTPTITLASLKNKLLLVNVGISLIMVLKSCVTPKIALTKIALTKQE